MKIGKQKIIRITGNTTSKMYINENNFNFRGIQTSLNY